MAHEISEITINGRRIAEAMYANNPAWHNLGEVFDVDGNQAPDSRTAAELAHLTWRVEKEDIFLSDGRKVPNNFALVRQDTRDALSVVGNDYTVLQIDQCFSFLDSLLQDGIMRYESAFALRGGRGIVLLARMPSVDTIVDQDSCLRYIVLSTWFGGGSTILTPTSVRVVCANTLRLALSDTTHCVAVRHSGEMDVKLRQARHYLSQFDKAFTLYCEDARRLLKGYTPAQAKDYMAELFPAPADDAGQRAKNNFDKRIGEVRSAFRSPANNLPGVRGTWWALFNAVTETIDHAKPLRETRDVVARRENRFINTMLGDSAAFKRRAFDLALALSA